MVWSNFQWYRWYKGGMWYHYKTASLYSKNVDYWCRPGENTWGALVEYEVYL